jgi:two-component sensor histidine kinase
MPLTALDLSPPAGHISLSRQAVLSPNGMFGDVADQLPEQQPDMRLRAIHTGLSEGLRVLQTFANGPREDADLYLSFYDLYGHYVETVKSSNDLAGGGEQGSVELKPFLKRILSDALAGLGERIHIWMGEIRLDPSVALILGMTIREFVKNSAALGALASQGGFAGIMCKVTTAPAGGARLALEWQEYGGRLITALPADGLAARLLTDGITAALNGRVEIACDAPGLRCRLDIPTN